MSDPNSGIMPGSSVEGAAFLAAVDAVPPSSPTACAGWNAHYIAAHLAAGAKEIADLIDESVPGRASRPTRDFEERETPFRALPHDKLLHRLVAENERKVAAWDALSQRREDPAIEFTGTRVTVEEFKTHSRSESAIHRWDLLGDDDTATELLAQPELTTHAVKMLNRMQILKESAQAMGRRAGEIDAAPVRIVFHSPNRRDVVLIASAESSRFELADGIVEGDATVATDPANRLLVLWDGDRPTGTSSWTGTPPSSPTWTPFSGPTHNHGLAQ